MITLFKKLFSLFKKKEVPSETHGGPLNLKLFNEKFMAGNLALLEGGHAMNRSLGLQVNAKKLKKALFFFAESLAVAGPYSGRMKNAIEILYYGLSSYEREDWLAEMNRLGIKITINPRNGIKCINEALYNAWPYIESINKDLTANNLGWKT